jgi:hypothetical protein
MQTRDHVKERKIKSGSREDAVWKIAWMLYFLSWKCATLDAQLRDTSTVKCTRKKTATWGRKAALDAFQIIGVSKRMFSRQARHILFWLRCRVSVINNRQQRRNWSKQEKFLKILVIARMCSLHGNIKKNWDPKIFQGLQWEQCKLCIYLIPGKYSRRNVSRGGMV